MELGKARMTIQAQTIVVTRHSALVRGTSRTAAIVMFLVATAFCSAPRAARPQQNALPPPATTVESHADGASSRVVPDADAAVPAATPSTAPPPKSTQEVETAETTVEADTSRHGWGKTITISAGTFTAGGGSALATERQARSELAEPAMGNRPTRAARLLEVKAFEIDVTEVTVEAYQRCFDAGECLLEPMDFEFCTWRTKGRRNHPVNCVGRFHAEQFCTWAKGRLPTEEEWEYAARGSDGRLWPWGNEFSPKGLCFNRLRSKVKTCAVGSSARDVSPFGVRDMAASVAEWTQSELLVTKPEDDKYGMNESYSVVRGGGWADVEPMRVSVNAESFPSAMDVRPDRGFRCVYPAHR